MVRALLTKREREVIKGNADVDREYRYQLISRVRNRIKRVEEDLDALDTHDSLGDELREVVCDD